MYISNYLLYHSPDVFIQSGSQLKNNTTKVIHPRETETWSKQTWCLAIIYLLSPSSNAGGQWDCRAPVVKITHWLLQGADFREGRGVWDAQSGWGYYHVIYKLYFYEFPFWHTMSMFKKKEKQKKERNCLWSLYWRIYLEEYCVVFRVVTSENNVGNRLRKTLIFSSSF